MGTRFTRSNGIKNGSSCHLANDKLPHFGFNGKCSSETLSMVANVPDSKCMWFDKSGRPISFNVGEEQWLCTGIAHYQACK